MKRKTKRVALIFALVALLAFMLAACTSTSRQQRSLTLRVIEISQQSACL